MQHFPARVFFGQNTNMSGFNDICNMHLFQDIVSEKCSRPDMFTAGPRPGAWARLGRVIKTRYVNDVPGLLWGIQVRHVRKVRYVKWRTWTVLRQPGTSFDRNQVHQMTYLDVGR